MGAQVQGKQELVWPMPATQKEMVAQTARAVRRAKLDGLRRQRVEWLLPVGSKKGEFLSTDPRLMPSNVGEEFNAACRLMATLLEEKSAAQSKLEVVSDRVSRVRAKRLDDQIDSDPVGLFSTTCKKYAAVVFPTADVLDELRALAGEQDRDQVLLLANPQWNLGNLVSDFGFGARREQSEAFVSGFGAVYTLIERRIGNTTNTLGLPLGSRRGGVVRLLKCYPGKWQVHIMEGRNTSREPYQLLDNYPSYRELEFIVEKYVGSRDSFLREAARRPVDPSNIVYSYPSYPSGRTWIQPGAKPGAGADAEADGEGPVPPPPAAAAEPAEAVPLYQDVEIAKMGKAMLVAALETLGQPVPETAEKKTSLEEIRAALKNAQQVRLMKATQKPIAEVVKMSRTGTCRLCGRDTGRKGHGVVPCPRCRGNASSDLDLACPICGGWGHTVCPACHAADP